MYYLLDSYEYYLLSDYRFSIDIFINVNIMILF